MYWIGVGFLIAIGFGIASIVLPAAVVILWEFRKGIGISIGVLALVLLAIILSAAYPEVAQGILGWAVLLFVCYSIGQQMKKRKKKTNPPIKE